MRLSALGLGLIIGAGSAGCGEPPASAPFPVVFEAVADPGEPLAGVALTAAGTSLGTTDADGRLATELIGTEGAMLAFEATCPAGHRAALPSVPLVLRRTMDLATGAPAVLRVTVACPPEVRHGVVVLRAGGEGSREGIPVMVDGVEVARTDRSGVAHVALDRAPGTTVSVTLATSAVLPDLTPHDPVMPFTFRDQDEIFLFDRPLDAPPAAVPERRPTHGHGHTSTEVRHAPPCRLGAAGCR